MKDLATLNKNQVAAFAAWKACPDKSKAEKSRLADALAEAVKAVAAYKRAAEPAAATITVAQALAGQKARTANEVAHGWYKDFYDQAETAYRLGRPEWGQ